MNWNFKIHRILCFPFHNWGKWETIEEGDILRRPTIFSDIARTIGTFKTQQRVCTGCNKLQLRTVKTVL